MERWSVRPAGSRVQSLLIESGPATVPCCDQQSVADVANKLQNLNLKKSSPLHLDLLGTLSQDCNERKSLGHLRVRSYWQSKEESPTMKCQYAHSPAENTTYRTHAEKQSTSPENVGINHRFAAEVPMRLCGTAHWHNPGYCQDRSILTCTYTRRAVVKRNTGRVRSRLGGQQQVNFSGCITKHSAFKTGNDDCQVRTSKWPVSRIYSNWK